MTSIYNFLKFIEEKTGKKMPLKVKIKVAPETLTKEDSIIDDGADLNSLTNIPEGFNPTVGGSLWLSGLKTVPEGFNPVVEGNLYLTNVTTLPNGFSPTVGGYLDLDRLREFPDDFNPIVRGRMFLGALKTPYTLAELKERFPNVKGGIFTN